MPDLKLFWVFISLHITLIYNFCTAPQIKGKILPNFGQDEQAVIVEGEQLLIGTTIEYVCNSTLTQSVCTENGWNPDVDFESCFRKKCTVKKLVSSKILVNANKGQEFKQLTSISYFCGRKKLSTSTLNREGIAICYNGLFWPPIECINRKEICLIPQLDGLKKIISHDNMKFINNGDSLIYVCKYGFTPTRRVSDSNSNRGTSFCVDGKFTKNSAPRCIAMCNTSSLSNINPLKGGNGFVENGKSISYTCNKFYPISKNDLEEKNMTLTTISGAGTVKCTEGVFETLYLCFSGCLMPNYVNSNQSHVLNGNTAEYFCDSTPNIIHTVNCDNNKFDKTPNCSLEYTEKCFLNVSRFVSLLTATEKTYLPKGFSIKYKCTQHRPISIEDLINNNKLHLPTGTGTIHCPIVNKPLCVLGCVVPSNIIHKTRFVLFGELFKYNCPPTHASIFYVSRCLGTEFSPRIFCNDSYKYMCPLKKIRRLLNRNINEYDLLIQNKQNVTGVCHGNRMNFTCLNGNWNTQILKQCIPHDCEIPLFNDIGLKIISKHKENIKIGDFVRYKCPENYLSASHAKPTGASFCSKNGEFVPPIDCLPILTSCIKPKIKNSVYVSGNSIIRNSENFTFKCEKGYLPSILNSHSNKEGVSVCKNGNHVLIAPLCQKKNTITPRKSLKYFLEPYQNKSRKCKFSKSVMVYSKNVSLFETFQYKCPIDKIPKGEVIRYEEGREISKTNCTKVKMRKRDLCKSRSDCIVPKIQRAIRYIAHQEEMLYLIPNQKVKTGKILQIQCGTYDLNSTCLRGKWSPRYKNKSCRAGCIIDVFGPIMPFDKSIGSFIQNGDFANFQCKNMERGINSKQFKIFKAYCIDQNFDFTNTKFCFEGINWCKVELITEKYTLVTPGISMTVNIGEELEYSCNGKFTGKLKGVCTQEGIKITELCSNECSIDISIENGNGMMTENIAEGEEFKYVCHDEFIISSEKSVCIRGNEGMVIQPPPECDKLVDISYIPRFLRFG